MIFGTAKSYIIDGATTITLANSITDFDLLQNQDVRHRSILTGKKTTSRLADYSEFTVTQYLFKESNPSGKFSTLRGLIDKEVYFYFQGSTIISNCYVSDVKPYYIRNLIRYDMVKITLFPIDYLSISGFIQTESGIDILTEDGQQIRTEGIII